MSEPSQRTRRAVIARDHAQRKFEQARLELSAAVAADLAAGVHEAKLMHLTGLSRDEIRMTTFEGGEGKHGESFPWPDPG